MIEEIGMLIKFLVNISPRVLIIIFCFYYIKKARSIDGYLMIAGSLILFFGVLSSILYYSYYFDIEQTDNLKIMNLISRVIRITGLGLFAIGFAIAINNYLNFFKSSKIKK